MSKSYNNFIPIFLTRDDLRKNIMKIKTDSKEPGDPKDPKNSTIFSLYSAFASEIETKELHNLFEEGIAWGEAKELLFKLLDNKLKAYRENYQNLVKDPVALEKILSLGAEKAMDVSSPLIREIRKAVGIRGFGG